MSQSVTAAAAATAAARTQNIPALTTSKPARFATIMMLYFLQGVPVGLSTVALTAWLAAQGAAPVEIGAFVAFVIEMGGYSATYLFMSVTSVIGLLLCLLARVGDEQLVTNRED